MSDPAPPQTTIAFVPIGKQWAQLLRDCAQCVREGYMEHAKQLARRAHDIEAAYPAEVKAELESWKGPSS